MKIRYSLTLICAIFGSTHVSAEELSIQSRFPPLQFNGSTPGGAHPVGGAANNFVNIANELLSGIDTKLVLHVSGGIRDEDKDSVKKPIVKRKEWGNLIKAVAAGSAKDGLTAYMGLPTESGLGFAEFYAGGIPFGLTAPEWIGFLYGGGGIELHQKLYDQAFENKLKVIPVAVSPSQTSGFFPEALPESNEKVSPDEAMKQFCDLPYIIRYPIGARYIIQDSCQAVGKDIDVIGLSTRCKDPKAECGTAENPEINKPEKLTFGGFAPGVIPHFMYINGNIDAFELAMPSGHMQFFKLAAKKQDQDNNTVSLSNIPPYHYTTSWHQTWVMTELVWNKEEWNALDPSIQTAIETAAQASVLSTYAQRLSAQGTALKNLERNGTKNLPWPKEMLKTFKATADKSLDRLAKDNISKKGDASLEVMLKAVREYKAQNAIFFDMDDISQGDSISH